MLALYHTTHRVFLFFKPTQMYVFIKHDFTQKRFLLKLLEKLYCKLQKQHIFILKIVVAGAPIVVLAPIIAHNSIFQIFTVLTDFCQKWRSQRYIVEVTPRLPPPCLVSKLNYKIWRLNLSRSTGNNIRQHFEKKLDEYCM